VPCYKIDPIGHLLEYYFGSVIINIQWHTIFRNGESVADYRSRKNQILFETELRTAFLADDIHEKAQATETKLIISLPN
jgi:hypothetical protein